MRRSALLFSGLILTVQACRSSTAVTSAEMPGRYGMRYLDSTDSLELRDNGEYHHRRWDAGNLAVDESGSWTFTTKDGDPAIELSKFSTGIILPAAHRPPPGWWMAPVGRDRLGRVFILVMRDIALRYTKM